VVGGEDPLAGCKTLDTAEGERGSRERRQRERERWRMGGWCEPLTADQATCVVAGGGSSGSGGAVDLVRASVSVAGLARTSKEESSSRCHRLAVGRAWATADTALPALHSCEGSHLSG